MKKPWYKIRKFSEWYKYKIVLEKILEFIHLMPDSAFQWEKKHYNTNDFTLRQFHAYIARKIDEEEYHNDSIKN